MCDYPPTSYFRKIYERRIVEYQNQIANQKKINANLIKQSKKQIEIEQYYTKMINKKDEEIKKLKEENLKLKDYVEQKKADIEKVNIEKNKEKEIQNLKDEIGVINIIDVNKLLNISKKFSSDILKIQNIKHCYIGNANSANNNNNVQDNEVNNDKNEINNDKNETNKKKKNKKSIIKKEGEQNSGNPKLCKKLNKTKGE